MSAWGLAVHERGQLAEMEGVEVVEVRGTDGAPDTANPFPADPFANNSVW